MDGESATAEPRLRRKVPTGIQGLDAQLDGGVPNGSTVLVLSEPTNSPYRLVEQFAAAGAERGETTLYYALDRPKDDAIERILAFTTPDRLGKHLQYVDCYSQKLRGMDESVLAKIGISNHSPKIPDHLMAAVLEKGRTQPFRLVLESLSEAIEVYGEAEAMKLFNNITSVIRRLNAVAIVLLTRGLHRPEVEMRARQLADGVLEFGVQRQGFGIYTFLSITKMRGLSEEVRMFMYRDTEKGLWLESTRRVM